MPNPGDMGDQSVFERSMPSDLIRGWKPVRVKKTRQIKNLEPRFDLIETEKALGAGGANPVDDEQAKRDILNGEGRDLGADQDHRHIERP